MPNITMEDQSRRTGWARLPRSGSSLRNPVTVRRSYPNSASDSDVAAMNPELVFSLDPPTFLRCVGTLNGRTRHHLLEIVEHMLRSGPGTITIDVEELRLADVDAANALTRVQRRVKDAGASVHWLGTTFVPTCALPLTGSP